MSPTPPISNTELCNGVTQPEYNPGSDQAKNQPVETSTSLMNGHSEEVKSAYFNNEDIVDNSKRRRNSKSGSNPKPQPNGAVKKRGRPPKVKTEDVPSKQSKITDTMKKAKRSVNRFKDVTKEELMERFLPDRIKPDLDILIIGINPGLYAAYKGHHYAGPGNHFWKCLYLSGLIPIPLTGMQDYLGLDYGIGFTNIVERTTPGSKDLSSKEIREGAKKLVEKIQMYKPKIAVFNGKGIYEIFSKEVFGQKKKDFVFGTQANKIPGTDTYIYVMASSSARCAQFPRAQDKVHFYVKLKQLRDQIRGVNAEDAPICEVGYTFDLKKATELAKVQNIKQERFDPDYEVIDATKNNTTNNYSVFAATSGATASGVQSTSHNATDVNNNTHNAIEGTVNPSGAPQTDKNINNKPVKIMPQKVAKEDNNITARHAHLVHYLRQDADSQEAGPSHAGRNNAGQKPVTLSPGNPKLQQDVSEEARQERVGNWVREQQSLEYDSEPPMGLEREDEGAPSGQEGSLAAPVEIDGASQLSAVSAGVSGSASESTSGYGSIDASSRRVRLDRVEMWVLEQQHVLRHNAGNQQQLQQSIQAASNSQQHGAPTTPQTIQNVYPNNNNATGWTQPVTHFGAVTPSYGVMHTQGGSIVTPTIPGQMFTNANRNIQKAVTHASHVADQIAGPSVSAGRSSPYGFNRVGTPSRREGGSGSSFGTAVRPPVPLFSSWGGEESNSGGSAISSPVVQLAPNPTTIPSPVQPFVTVPNAPMRNVTSQNFSNSLAMSWQSAGGNNMLTPPFNM